MSVSSVHERLLVAVTGNPGVGAVTVGAAIAGYQAFVAGDNTNLFDVCIFDCDAQGNPNGNWEVQAQSPYTHAGTSLARAAGRVVDGSSGPGVLVNFAAGTQRLMNVLSSAGVEVIRKTGGTAGTDEVRLSYQTIAALQIPNTAVIDCGGTGLAINGRVTVLDNGFTAAKQTIFIDSSGQGNITVAASGSFAWSGTANVASGKDTAFRRLAARVIGAYDGGTLGAYVQDSAGEEALLNNFTNNNGVLTSTNFSFPVFAGRSYRITGMLQVANSTAGEGVKFAFDGGTATASLFTLVVSAIGTNVVGTQTAPSLVSVISFSSITGTNFLILSGYLLVLNGGTLIVRMAENTSATGTLTLSAGSWIKLADTVQV